MMNVRELRDRTVIRPIKRAVEDLLLDLPGVVAVDIGTKRVAGRSTGQQVIVVSVSRKEPADRLHSGSRVPARIFDIPTDVVEERISPHYAHHVSRAGAGQRRRKYGSISGGEGIAPARPVVVGPCEADRGRRYRRVGTLGALVVGHEPAVPVMGLTTFDVACMDDAWSVGDPMVDPEDGQVFADLSRAALSGRVDAAAVNIGRPAEHSGLICGVGSVTGQCVAYPGVLVRKCGFGTGLTRGTVVSTDTTLRLDHGDALGVRVLRDQMRVTAARQHTIFAAPGDAGAVLVDIDGRVLGLHVAGTSDGSVGFASPIRDVLTELDVDLGVARRPVRASGEHAH